MPSPPRHTIDNRRAFAAIAFLMGAGFLWPLFPDSELKIAVWGLLFIAAAAWLIVPRRL